MKRDLLKLLLPILGIWGIVGITLIIGGVM